MDFIVIRIGSAQPGIAEFRPRWIVRNGEECWKHRLADFLGKRLAFFVAALALALKPMAEHFMEKDRRGASGKNRRPVERLGQRSFAQRFEALAQFAHSGFEFSLLGQPLDCFRFKGLRPKEIHAIFGAAYGEDDQPGHLMGIGEARTLGGGKVIGLALGGQHDDVLVHVWEFAKAIGQLADAIFPHRLIDHRGRSGLIHMNLR